MSEGGSGGPTTIAVPERGCALVLLPFAKHHFIGPALVFTNAAGVQYANRPLVAGVNYVQESELAHTHSLHVLVWDVDRVRRYESSRQPVERGLLWEVAILGGGEGGACVTLTRVASDVPMPWPRPVPSEAAPSLPPPSGCAVARNVRALPRDGQVQVESGGGLPGWRHTCVHLHLHHPVGVDPLAVLRAAPAIALGDVALPSLLPLSPPRNQSQPPAPVVPVTSYVGGMGPLVDFHRSANAGVMVPIRVNAADPPSAVKRQSAQPKAERVLPRHQQLQHQRQVQSPVVVRGRRT